MTNISYIVTSLTWAMYGLVLGFGAGSLARLMWDRE
jgi:hypothetical protein